MDEFKKRPGNPLWKAGMQPVPGGGRPKGSKRNPLASLQRWYARNASVKELERIYMHLPTERDQWEMIKGVLYYIAPKPTANAITAEEMEALLQKQIQLEQRNRNLEQELKRLKDVEYKAI